MDLVGPTRVKSLGGKKYFLIIIDDFSRYTWVAFLREKFGSFKEFKSICKRIQNDKEFLIKKIRGNHGGEFKNNRFLNKCNELGIKHKFSMPKTPQQNRVAKRKNVTLQEMKNVMLTNKNFFKRFWVEAINITCYTTSRVYLRLEISKTTYEFWNDKKPNVKNFKVISDACYVLRDRENLGKFDAKSDKAIFLSYSTKSMAYRVFNKRTQV